jgi:prevent-host-death family protein
MTTNVGVRELSRGVSRILDLVEEGETFVVTRHGKPIARLVPFADAKEEAFDRLVREGVIKPAAKHKRMEWPKPAGLPREVVDEILRER